MILTPIVTRFVRFRAVLLGACLALCSTTMAAASAPAPQDSNSEIGGAAPGDAIQAWISANAVSVRSIAATDEDFSDLEPLVDAIGSARVVQLGEPSHKAGRSFAAKVRLIKFLHQRMGFDVLAWESGLYDVRLTQAGLRAGEDAVTAAQRGILKVWSATEEVAPLFEYARASQAGLRPLVMAGFDMQVTAPDFAERFAADLRSFVGALRDSTLRHRATRQADEAISAHRRLFSRSEARRLIEAEVLRTVQPGRALALAMRETMAAWEKTEGGRLRPTKEDLLRLQRAADGLLASIRSHRAAFEQVHGRREISFMARAIENMRGTGMNVYDSQRPDRPTGSAGSALYNEGWNRRDALNADNLRWLIEEGYPGRKIIVWAHNAHLMNAYFAADLGNVSLHLEPQPGGLKPTGVFLADWLKDEIYTVATTTYEGKEGFLSSAADSATPIPPAAQGSLESRLHRLGKPYVFLDFRTLDDSSGHPMRTPQSMRINFYRGDTVSDLTRAFDAVFYIERMTPATRTRRGEDK